MHFLTKQQHNKRDLYLALSEELLPQCALQSKIEVSF